MWSLRSYSCPSSPVGFTQRPTEWGQMVHKPSKVKYWQRMNENSNMQNTVKSSEKVIQSRQLFFFISTGTVGKCLDLTTVQPRSHKIFLTPTWRVCCFCCRLTQLDRAPPGGFETQPLIASVIHLRGQRETRKARIKSNPQQLSVFCPRPLLYCSNKPLHAGQWSPARLYPLLLEITFPESLSTVFEERWGYEQPKSRQRKDNLLMPYTVVSFLGIKFVTQLILFGLMSQFVNHIFDTTSKKTYFGIVCDSIYESQSGLREKSGGTVSDQRSCSLDKGVVWELVSLQKIHMREARYGHTLNKLEMNMELSRKHHSPVWKVLRKTQLQM